MLKKAYKNVIIIMLETIFLEMDYGSRSLQIS